MIDVLKYKPILDKFKNDSSVVKTLLGLTTKERLSLNHLLAVDNDKSARPDSLQVLYNAVNYVNDTPAFIDLWFKMYSSDIQNVNVLDAFSIGQLSSKSWLIDQLEILKIPLGKVWLLGGWIGVLAYLMFERPSLQISTIRSFDLDDYATNFAELVNHKKVKDNWAFKATTFDVNNLLYKQFTYVTYKTDKSAFMLTDTADTVINTSCDHMGDNYTWWNNIPEGKLVILQNNDYAEVDDHDNIVHDIEEFAVKYPMSSLLYSGKLECSLYNRYMLIGRK